MAATGNTVAEDPLPEENIFVRSDHYEFVKKGVPALMMAGFPGGDPAPPLARLKKWMDTDYHSPRDVILPDWELERPADGRAGRPPHRPPRRQRRRRALLAPLLALQQAARRGRLGAVRELTTAAEEHGHHDA